MKILRTIVILALVAGLVLGGVGTAFAKKPPDVPRGGGPHSPGKRGLSGNVTSVETITAGEEYVIDLETKRWGTVHVTANVIAKYMVPRETHGAKDLATFLEIVDENEDGDLEELEGRRLAVLATNLVEGGYVPITADAIRLMLIPSPAHHRYMHRVGVVQAFTEGTSITIIDKDGEPHTFDLNGTTVYRPEGTTDVNIVVGSPVTVVTTGDPKLGTAIAKAIVLHDELPDWAPEP